MASKLTLSLLYLKKIIFVFSLIWQKIGCMLRMKICTVFVKLFTHFNIESYFCVILTENCLFGIKMAIIAYLSYSKISTCTLMCATHIYVSLCYFYLCNSPSDVPTRILIGESGFLSKKVNAVTFWSMFRKNSGCTKAIFHTESTLKGYDLPLGGGWCI